MNKIRLEKERLSPDITFHPKISKKTREITKNVNNKIKIEDRLIALGKEREKRLLKKVAEKRFIENSKCKEDDNNENSEYSFQLKINNPNLIRIGNTFDRLYNISKNSKNKTQKRNEEYFNEKYPFKPQKFTKSIKNGMRKISIMD